MLNLPEPDNRTLAKAPLDLVVCQLRYENNLGVSDSRTARAFQEAFGGRHGRYPLVEQILGRAVNVTVDEESAKTTTAPALSGWRFSGGDDGWTVSLMPDHVAVETSAYVDWAGFRQRLEEVLRAAADVVEPAFEQRLGLRYIDRLGGLQIEKPQDWARYISRDLLGPVVNEDLGPAVRAMRQILSIHISDELSCNFAHGFVVDSDGSELDFGYLLDYDLFRNVPRPFDVDDVLETTDQLNHIALQLFQASIDRDYWEQLAG
jgi:uncharacterized protein (TIGR04255 family)